LAGNVDKILTFCGKAREAEAQLVVFPEMALCGYPPRDLVERTWWVEEQIKALDELKAKIKGITAIVGYVERNPIDEGKSLFNAAAVIENGDIAYITNKCLLPTYDVFDEERYFEPGRSALVVKVGDKKIAITICEDLWTDEVCGPRKLYHKDPLEEVKKKRFQLIVNLSASPWWLGKEKLREQLVKNKAKENNVPVLLVNQVGGNDELLFDGTSICSNEKGDIIATAKSFEEDLMMVDLQYGAGDAHGTAGSDPEMIYRALVMGTRDFAHKCGFTKAVVGLSGGIDSAVVAAIATQALGADNVTGITMPSEFSSEGSKTDSAAVAKNLGIHFSTIPIQGIYKQYTSELGRTLEGKKFDVTEENLQSRIRGNMLMAVSNKLGHLVLSTGNKSELATGYCTLYGDMAGGLAVINKDREIIPSSTMTKAPSAELRANQKDSDTLPPYDVLDPILEQYIVQRKGPTEIIASGVNAEVVKKVVAMVEKAEYKRRQMAPGLKVTSKAFGVGRRYPIARKT
jgi:NAD+ synthetase